MSHDAVRDLARKGRMLEAFLLEGQEKREKAGDFAVVNEDDIPAEAQPELFPDANADDVEGLKKAEESFGKGRLPKKLLCRPGVTLNQIREMARK